MSAPWRLALAVVALAASACVAGSPAPQPEDLTYSRWRALTDFTEQGVHVEIVLDEDSLGHMWLAGVYTPIEPDSYLYSAHMPAAGIQGLGRPTVLAVVPPSEVKVLGPVVPNLKPHEDRVESLNLTLPVYPPGPVTLRLPIEIPGVGSSARVTLAVGYMACGPRGCMPPVEGKRVSVNLR
jgi:hypothetical protein